MFEWFKHSYMFKMLNNLTISYFQVPVHPFGFCHSLNWCSFFTFHGFFKIWTKVHGWGKTSSHLHCDWTGYNWIFTGDVRKLICDECRMLILWNDEKLVSGYWILVLDKNVEHRMTDDLGYIIDECGRFSISSWLVAGCPTPKTENHLKSPKFWRFSI